MEERKMILKMIEDGKITAEEGIKLLEVMEKEPAPKQETKRPNEAEVSTNVKWDEDWQEDGPKRKKSHTSTSAANLFTSFIESTIQKIRDVDLDFNFGSAIEVDHIFQHRDVSPSSLDVSLENGSIEFEPWDESDVRLECHAKVYRVKDVDEARRFFLDESVFRVDEHKLLFHTRTKAMKVQTKIFVPRVLFQHIKLYTFNGQISGERIHADTFDVNAMNGSLTFDDVKAKKAFAETVNGAIQTKNVTMDLLDVKTLNGGITISGQVQDLDAETVNGSVIYELDRLSESGYVDAKATTGSIHLFIPRDLRIEGKLKTNVGNFNIGMRDYEELEEKKEFAQKALSFIGNQQSSPRVKVTALTNTGTIQINDR